MIPQLLSCNVNLFLDWEHSRLGGGVKSVGGGGGVKSVGGEGGGVKSVGGGG